MREFLLGYARKAGVAFLGTALVGLGGAGADGNLTLAEVVVVLTASLAAAGAVFAVPNAPKE